MIEYTDENYYSAQVKFMVDFTRRGAEAYRTNLTSELRSASVQFPLNDFFDGTIEETMVAMAATRALDPKDIDGIYHDTYAERVPRHERNEDHDSIDQMVIDGLDALLPLIFPGDYADSLKVDLDGTVLMIVPADDAFSIADEDIPQMEYAAALADEVQSKLTCQQRVWNHETGQWEWEYNYTITGALLGTLSRNFVPGVIRNRFRTATGNQASSRYTDFNPNFRLAVRAWEKNPR